MNDCVVTGVRDALPDLLHGRLSELDTATMTAHVGSCPECRAELALLREVKSAAPLAPEMDVVRIASSLPRYGGAAVMHTLPAKPARKTSLRFAMLAAAAALVVALGGVAVTTVRNSNDAAQASAVASATQSGATQSTGTAEIVAPAASAPDQSVTKEPTRVGIAPVQKQVASLSFVGGTQDLSDSELEMLLAELDGMESIPAAEPQSVTLSVEGIEGGT
ncbi:MAG: zf-HC2 domain-containing protein [Gemmatimonadales bacterium]